MDAFKDGWTAINQSTTGLSVFFWRGGLEGERLEGGGVGVGNGTNYLGNELEPIYFERKWNRFTWKRNGTDIFGNEMEPITAQLKKI